MFRDTLALNMNPFGPTFPDSPENRARLEFVTNLDRVPLRLDQCDEALRPLFCKEILDLETHMERFHDLMTIRGYAFGNDAARSMDSAIVLIRGDTGAGKSTLGAWMIAEMVQLPGKRWGCFDVPEPTEDNKAAWDISLNLLRDQIVAVPAGDHIAALVENVSKESLNAAIALFNELRKWPRLFVVTTNNIKLLDADARTIAGAAQIEVFTLRQIIPADANAYVLHRLPQYRDPHRPEIEKLSPVFPFAPGMAGRFVQRGADAGAVPVVLRQLNTHFRGKLVEHSRRLRSRLGYVPVDRVSEAALTDYLLPDV